MRAEASRDDRSGLPTAQFDLIAELRQPRQAASRE